QLTFDDFFAKVTYTPEHDYCGVDTFVYQITDSTGLRSSTQVKVNVLCDKVLVYNGISPNGDGKNDVWHIPGIDFYPDNEVQIFNRWGNLVFKQKGYSNSQAWDGTWNGHGLPDGAYFYIIDLGDGTKPLSGYLQVQR
ncbi:MAG: gliding motility-associated C-terminal domain-containing protein, partial [Saprospiraceae bacterium]|nr:gliding motility-associated C-terminal domain-containing protein [Saprospiraceae bacterium]